MGTLLPGSALAGGWSREPELGLEPKHSDMEAGVLTGGLTTESDAYVIINAFQSSA